MSRLDKWQIDGISRGIREGRSQREIAKIVGCHLSTVNAVCQKQKNESKKREEIINLPSIPQREIDLTSEPTTESVKTDILTVYRHTLYELNKRVPTMTDDQVYQLSMQLLGQLNNGNSES